MKDTKLYRVLKDFSKVDLNRLSKYIASPYFNANEELISFYEFIKPGLPKDQLPEENTIWDHVYPKDKFTDSKFRKLLTSLLSLVENFLIQENIQSKILFKHNMLLEKVREEKIEELYQKTITNSSREFDRRREESADYYYQKYLLQKNQYNLTSPFERKVKKKMGGETEDIKELSQTLDTYYLIEKMRHGKDLLTWRRMYKADVNLAPYEFTTRLIERSNYLEIPAVRMYYLIYKAFVEEDSKQYYFELKKMLESEVKEFPFTEQQEFFDSAISYCIGMINRGERDFIPEALEMYNQAIEKETLLKDGELSPTDFRNVIVIALRYGYLDYAKDFIDDKSQLINPKFRDNAVNFNLARVHFYGKEFEAVLDKLNLVDFEDVWYNINSKAMLIATYYELDEDNALDSLLTSYNAFIRREKSLEENRRQGYLNFIKIVRKLVKSYGLSKEKMQDMKEQAQAMSPLINKVWVLEKVEELVNGK